MISGAGDSSLSSRISSPLAFVMSSAGMTETFSTISGADVAASSTSSFSTDEESELPSSGDSDLGVAMIDFL
jgi:hypothetical protein